MPRDATRRKIRRRGGELRVRTKRIGRRHYLTIHVVRKPGPRGGRTVAGPVRQRKSSRVKGQRR
jgi:hypothetical protein